MTPLADENARNIIVAFRHYHLHSSCTFMSGAVSLAETIELTPLTPGQVGNAAPTESAAQASGHREICDPRRTE